MRWTNTLKSLVFIPKVSAHIRRFITTNLKKNRFVSNLSLLIGSSAVAQLAVILSSPILTRLYSPNDFGILTAFISTFSVLLVVGSFRYELAIGVPKDDKTAVGLLVVSLLVLAGITVAFLPILMLLLVLFPSGGTLEKVQPFLWLLPFALFGGGTYQCLTFWAMRRQTFDAIAKTKITKTISLVTVQLMGGIFALGALPLILGDIISRFAGIRTLTKDVLRQDFQLVKRLRWSDLANASRKYVRYPKLAAPAALINRAALQAPPLLLISLYGTEVGGWFGLTQRVALLPLALIGQSISQVYIGELSKLIRESSEKIRKLYFLLTKRLLLVGLLPTLFLLVGGPFLFRFVFGDEWAQSGVYVQVLAPMFLIQLSATPLSQTLNLIDGQRVQLVVDILNLVLIIGMMYLTFTFELGVLWTLGAYSFSNSLTYVLAFFLTLRRINKVTVN